MVAVLGPRRQRFADDGVNVGINAPIARRRQQELPLTHLARHLAIVGAFGKLIQALAGQQLVQDHARRVDVGAPVDKAAAQQLLGRHVAELAKADVRVAVGGAQGAASDAEVDDLHLALKAKHDVGRRDVAVYQRQRLTFGSGATMGVGQPGGNIASNQQAQIHRQLDLQLAAATHQPPQVATFDVLDG